MKKIIYIIALLPILIFSACRDEKLGKTIFPEPTGELSAFDQWLYDNYVKTYNIRFDYNWNWNESDQSSALLPADIQKSQKMAQFVKTAWLDAYLEVADSTWLKRYAPKLMITFGAVKYGADRQGFQAEAAGGVKVHFYDVNNFDVNNKDWMVYYVLTVHHEFMHILNQTIKMPAAFKLVNESDYLYADFKDSTTYAANKLGFVTAYARKNVDEDFAEMYCNYITMTPAEWTAFLLRCDSYNSPGNTIASERLTKKVGYLKEYVSKEYGFDLDSMRVVALRKVELMYQLTNADFIDFE